MGSVGSALTGGLIGGAGGAIAGGLFGGGGSDGADAAKDAAKIQANYQREALEYLKEREELPQQFREGALSRLGGFYGLEGGEEGARRFIEQNPLYKATVGMLPAQEEAILRSQSATGALRTSATEQMLAENQRRNQLAAYQTVLGGLGGIASIPSNAGAIAQQTAGIGQTLGQGIVGAAQSENAANQAMFSNLLGLGGLGIAAVGAFCDPALKYDAKKISEYNGLAIYRWHWNKTAQEKLNLKGTGIGFMADEVEKVIPEAVTTGPYGFKLVDVQKVVEALTHD